MPVFLAALGGVLINIAATVAGRVLIALGIGVVTYTGLDTTLDWLKSQAINSLSGLPADFVSLIAFLKVGVCINIIASATAARFVLQGLTGGAVKKWVLK